MRKNRVAPRNDSTALDYPSTFFAGFRGGSAYRVEVVFQLLQTFRLLLATAVVLGVLSAQTPTASKAAPSFKVGDIAMAYSMFGWIQVRILEVRGNEYRIHYMDRTDMWVKASNLRRPTAAMTSSGAGRVPPGGGAKQAPGPCPASLDGTYEDHIGLLSIAFRAGKATVTQPLAGTYEADCRTQGNQILLQRIGGRDSLLLTRKDERTLEDRDAGAITKK